MTNDNNTAFVGNIPEHYDRELGPVIFVDYAAEVARRVAMLAPSSVLETAAGTGIVTRALRDALPAGTKLTATDLSPAMLDVARSKFGPNEVVGFQPADAMALPFAAASFDAVVCQFGIMFYPDKDLGAREVFRVLQPAGTYFVSIWDGHRNNPFGRIAHGVTERLFPKNPPQFYRVPFSSTFDEVKDSLIAAGFVDINAAVLRLNKTVDDITAFARGLVYGNPMIEQIRARGGIDPEAVVGGLAGELGRAFGTGPATVPLQTILFSARKPGPAG
jgi:ubiquinone/menaquinone biosynthesis C-methylase UbiE